MMIKKILLVSIIIFCSFYSSSVLASGSDEKFKFTFSERTRLTAFDNSISLNDLAESWVFTRHRTSLGFKCQAFKGINFTAQLTNESRIWFTPQVKESKFSEIFFDQLYMKWKKVGGIALDLTVGRQNIMLDEGFVCLDGQPLTGSRSAYFNAVRGDFSLGKNHSITSFYSYVPHSDDLLPIINEDKIPQALEEQGNTGFGLYYKGKINRTKLSVYYFNKHTKANDVFPEKSDINAFGARLVTPLSGRINFTAEGAIQSGKFGKQDRSAFGGYAYLDYKLKPQSKGGPIASLGSFYLSGDDPTTKKVEGWDPLWSRWPKWSESYIYTLIVENKGKVAYWSNISSYYASLKGNLSQKLSFQTTYHHLMAVEDNITDFCSGSGKNRGDLLILRLNYKIDKKWSGHLVVENFNPGNFYASKADGYNWFRFELLFRL